MTFTFFSLFSSWLPLNETPFFSVSQSIPFSLAFLLPPSRSLLSRPRFIYQKNYEIQVKNIFRLPVITTIPNLTRVSIRLIYFIFRYFSFFFLSPFSYGKRLSPDARAPSENPIIYILATECQYQYERRNEKKVLALGIRQDQALSSYTAWNGVQGRKCVLFICILFSSRYHFFFSPSRAWTVIK